MPTFSSSGRLDARACACACVRVLTFLPEGLSSVLGDGALGGGLGGDGGLGGGLGVAPRPTMIFALRCSALTRARNARLSNSTNFLIW